jgi:exosortase
VSPAAVARVAIICALLALVYWGPIRYSLVWRWLNDGNWSHGFLIPVISLYFLWTEREELLRCCPRPSYFGAVILALSLAVYFLSAWRLRMAYPQALSIVGTIFGVTLLMGGRSVIRIAWFPIVYLLLAIPLPQWLYVELTMPLRMMASTIAAVVMPVFVPDLYTEAQAVVIDYNLGDSRGTLNVEEACSGMRLMMAFVALGAAMAYIQKGPLWQRAVMVLSCIPVAVMCNAIRVTITGLLYVHGNDSLASGTPHQLLGIATLGIALGLFALIGYVLNNLVIEDEPEEHAQRA